MLRVGLFPRVLNVFPHLGVVFPRSVADGAGSEHDRWRFWGNPPLPLTAGSAPLRGRQGDRGDVGKVNQAKESQRESAATAGCEAPAAAFDADRPSVG